MPFDGDSVLDWEREQQQRDIVSSIAERQAHELVRKFLANECTVEERELYRLRFDEDLSQGATAEQLSMTRIQVRRRESKLKKRLLRFLKRASYV